MKRIMTFLLSLFLSFSASAHVCDNLREIKGFNYSILFNNTIMNGNSINYYAFSSICKTDCLYKNFEKSNIRHSTNSNNISIFNTNSVATITIDNTDRNSISGYLTCSSNVVRSYISIPISINTKKVTLDLQTEDNNNISRMLNVQNYTQREYSSLMSSLEKLASSREKIIGFTSYKIINNRIKNVVKVSNLSPNGDFILIVEKLK